MHSIIFVYVYDRNIYLGKFKIHLILILIQLLMGTIKLFLIFAVSKFPDTFYKIL